MRAQDPSSGDAPILSLDPGSHTAPVTQVLFTPDGQELVSVGLDKVTRIWDVKTGESKRTIRGQVGAGPLGKLYAAALSPDGQTLAVGGFLHAAGDLTYYIRLLDPKTGRVLRVLPGLFKPSLSLAFSPDGSKLVSGEGTGTLRVFDVQTGATYPLKGHTKDVYGVCFSPDGRQVASASLDGTVRLWSLDSRKGRALDGHCPDGFRCIAWSPDNRLIAAGGFDRVIRVWDGATGVSLAAPPPQDKYSNCLAFSPDSKRLAAGLGADSGQCAVRLWPAGPSGVSPSPEGEFRQHTAPVQSIAFSPDGKTMASAGGLANDIYLWTVPDGKVTQHIVSTGGAAQDVAWSPESSKITWNNAAAAGPVQHTFDLANRALVANAGGAWQGAVLTQNGVSLGKSSTSEEVQLSSGTHFRVSNRDGDLVHCYTWTPSGDIVVGSTYGLALYDKNGRPRRGFVGHTSDVLSVSVSPNGKYLASASGDETVRIWPLDESAAGDDGKVSPLMSLFVGSDREWVAWTRSGFYTCSTNGENIMGWQINKGDDQEAAYFPASRFHGKLYRDDILSHLLEAGSEEQAVTMADAGRGEKTDLSKTAANLAQIAPPTVEIVEPSDGAVIADGQVSVKVRITDSNHRPLRTLQLTDNGRAAPLPADARPVPQEGEQTLSTSLVPGDNTLSVVVTNDAGAQSSPATVKVTYGSGTPVRIGQPALYVLSIGVSEYLDSTNSLQYPAKDASNLSELLKSQEGPGKMFSKVVVTKLTDRKATRDSITRSLTALRKLAKEMAPTDYTLVFVAGHGTNDDLDQYFFAPYDIDTSDIDSSGVNWLAFSQTLAAMPGRVILMLDTCHSAGASESKVSKKDGYGQFLVATSLDRFNNESPVVTFASCGKGELSQESADWNDGAFTKALVEGLSGQADTNHDGVVTIKELDQYLRTRVSGLTKDAQHPVLEKPMSISSDMPLAVVGPLVSHTASSGATPAFLARTP